VYSLETSKHFPLMFARISLCALISSFSCAPTSVDRAAVTDDDGGVGGNDAALSDAPHDVPATGGSGGLGTGGVGTGGMGTGGVGTGGAAGGTSTGGAGGSGSGGARDAGRDVASGGTGGGSPDVAPDVPVDVVPDAGLARKALLVVGAPGTLTKGDQKAKMLLEALGFTVTIGDDNAAATAATGMALVVLCSSSDAATLAAKYKDVTVPVLDLESAVYDDMKMTAAADGSFDETDGPTINILPAMQAHPLAAGKMGVITVSSGNNGLNWGKVAPTAIAVASIGATVNANRITIFGYDTGAKMIDDFAAPARRVGLFAADGTLGNLSADGASLINAAVGWLVP
jgi:hypothetical protein